MESDARSKRMSRQSYISRPQRPRPAPVLSYEECDSFSSCGRRLRLGWTTFSFQLNTRPPLKLVIPLNDQAAVVGPGLREVSGSTQMPPHGQSPSAYYHAANLGMRVRRGTMPTARTDKMQLRRGGDDGPPPAISESMLPKDGLGQPGN